ncbi:MAG: tetratricopeptide repeat protein [bacterium]|nr:tetratricopeptide repeat protein [bacterium]
MTETIENNRFSLKSWIVFLVYFFPVFIVFILYSPILEFQFVNWDDDIYIYKNQNIRTIDFEFIKSLFIEEFNRWHPITIVSHAIDYSIWEENPWGHHLTSLIFHAINTLLVFILAIKLQKHINNSTSYNEILFAGFITSLIFGMHPIHVEAVAWISARKELLYSFFYFLSLLSYLKYVELRPLKKNIHFWSSIGFFFLALESKPMAVSLPIVLLIFDFYPLQRFTKKSAKKVLIEKLPFLILSILVSIITLFTYGSAGHIISLNEISFFTRVLLVSEAYLFYLLKMIFSVGLAPLYPQHTVTNYLTIGTLLFMLLTMFFYIFAKKKFLPIVWLYFVTTLIPVVGIVQSNILQASDRYMYLPSFMPFLLVGIYVRNIFFGNSQKLYRITFFILFLSCFAIFTYKSVTQISIWTDSTNLWNHQIKLYPKSNSTAYTNRGLILMNLGKYRDAIKDFNIAIEINSQGDVAYYNLAVSYDMLKNYELAIKNYNEAIKYNPFDADYFNGRGIIYQKLGDFQKALKNYNRAIIIDPENEKYFYHRGTAYYDLANYRLALKSFNKAIEINPTEGRIYNNRGNTFLKLGNYHQAKKDYFKAISLLPASESLTVYYNLGLVFSELGNHKEALIYYKKAEKMGFK